GSQSREGDLTPGPCRSCRERPPWRSEGHRSEGLGTPRRAFPTTRRRGGWGVRSAPYQSLPITSPPARVLTACQVFSDTWLDPPGRLPSAMATVVKSRRRRGPARPPSPPQSTSGLVSLSARAALVVVCKNRPSIHEAPRLPAIFLPSLNSCTPALSLRFFSAALVSATCWRLTVTALVFPSPLSVSTSMTVLLVPSVMSVSLTAESR